MRLSCDLLAKSVTRIVSNGHSTSIIPSQVHSRVQRLHLIGVAVEHERLAPEELADPPLRCLAPTRMIDGRIDVRIKAVLVRRVLLPAVERLLFDESHSHD